MSSRFDGFGDVVQTERGENFDSPTKPRGKVRMWPETPTNALSSAAGVVDPANPPHGKARLVRVTQWYWLNLIVPFTSTATEQKQGSTKSKQFPLLVKSAWSNLVDVRAKFTDSATGIPLSTQLTPLLTYAGNTNLVHPQLRWARPYYLRPTAQFNGEFINDGAQAAGNVVFFGERPNLNHILELKRTMPYALLLNLNLNGGATTIGSVETQAIEYDLIIWGMLSTSASMTVRFTDSETNNSWSQDKLPIGAFAGIRATANVQPIIYYPTPYYLPANSSIIADWTNVGSETGKFLSFVCERILQ